MEPAALPRTTNGSSVAMRPGKRKAPPILARAVDRLRQLAVRAASISILGLELPLLVLWFVLATVLSTITDRIRDWNVMTDELVWERLAISVGQWHSVLPRLHGEVIRSLSQLYPLLLAPFFWSGFVSTDLQRAHVFNAWLMSSAAIPAFLLARRVTGRRWPAYVTALLAACTPWIVYSTVLLTEVAAYPVFLWAILAMHKAITDPAPRNDLLLVLALAIAFLARTQFGLLLVVLPVALVLFHLRSGLREALRGHLVLVCLYMPLLVGGLVLELSGHALTHLSVYGGETAPHVLSGPTAGSFTGHAADLAFGVGILPFLVGSAWLLANAVQGSAGPRPRAFACIAGVTTVIVLVVVAAWDLTIGHFVIDRYLFYLVPLLLLAVLCALLDARRPRWSLVIPTAVVAVGFATHLQSEFLWSGQFPLSFDSPIATLYKPIVDLGGSMTGAGAILAVATVALAALFVLATRLLRPPVLTAVAVVLLLVTFPADTGYTFVKLLDRNGHAERPLTRSEAGILDWVDRTVGTGAQGHPGPLLRQHRVPRQPEGVARPRVLEQVDQVRDPLPLDRRVRRRTDLVPEQHGHLRPGNRRRRQVALALRRPERVGVAFPDLGERAANRPFGCHADRCRHALANRLADLRPLQRRLDAPAGGGARPRVRRSEAARRGDADADLPAPVTAEHRERPLLDRDESREGAGDGRERRQDDLVDLGLRAGARVRRGPPLGPSDRHDPGRSRHVRRLHDPEARLAPRRQPLGRGRDRPALQASDTVSATRPANMRA